MREALSTGHADGATRLKKKSRISTHVNALALRTPRHSLKSLSSFFHNGYRNNLSGNRISSSRGPFFAAQVDRQKLAKLLKRQNAESPFLKRKGGYCAFIAGLKILLSESARAGCYEIHSIYSSVCFVIHFLAISRS